MGFLHAIIAWLIDPVNLTAISTLIIALLTVFLAVFGGFQARLTRRSIDLAREQFVASQRPRLRVRHVVVDDPLLPQGSRVSGEFHVVNIGGAPAQVTGSHCMVFWSRTGLPMKRPYDDVLGNTPIGSVRIHSGEAKRVTFRSDELITMQADPTKRVINGAMVYVMGWIDYRDDVGISRRTAFCREYRLPKGEGMHEARFWPIEDPDYEHEE